MSSQSDRVTSAVRWRWSALGVLAGLAVAAVIVVPSTLAASKHAGAPSTQTVAKPAPTGSTGPTGTTKTPAPAGTGSNAPDPVFTSAIAQLEQAGTIDSAQAQAIDAQLQSHSIDLQQLVNSRTITAAQAQAVQNALRQAKMSLGPTNG